jgi:hypothetical protein
MKKKERLAKKRNGIKAVLRLPDLEHAKAAVLNSVTSSDSQRGHRHAIDEFVEWYCSTVIVSGRFLMTGISSRNMSLLQDGSSKWPSGFGLFRCSESLRSPSGCWQVEPAGICATSERCACCEMGNVVA